MPKANAQKALGLFSEPTYMGVGDPYDPPMERSGRAKGLNMITSPIKKGRVPQYTNFDKTFRRVSEGDTYKMPGQDERQYLQNASTTSSHAVLAGRAKLHGISAILPTGLHSHTPQSTELALATPLETSVDSPSGCLEVTLPGSPKTPCHRLPEPIS